MKTISGFYDSKVWIQSNATLWPMGKMHQLWSLNTTVLVRWFWYTPILKATPHNQKVYLFLVMEEASFQLLFSLKKKKTDKYFTQYSITSQKTGSRFWDAKRIEHSRVGKYHTDLIDFYVSERISGNLVQYHMTDFRLAIISGPTQVNEALCQFGSFS